MTARRSPGGQPGPGPGCRQSSDSDSGARVRCPSRVARRRALFPGRHSVSSAFIRAAATRLGCHAVTVPPQPVTRTEPGPTRGAARLTRRMPRRASLSGPGRSACHDDFSLASSSNMYVPTGTVTFNHWQGSEPPSPPAPPASLS
jgi:hypothetical protein